MTFSRRMFDTLIMAGAAALSLSLASPALAQGVTIPAERIGVVTGSLDTGLLRADPRGSLEAATACGVDVIEFSFSDLDAEVPAFSGVPVTDIAALGEEFGYIVPSLGIGAGDLTERYDQTVEIAKTLGATHLRISGVDDVEGEPLIDYYTRLADTLNEYGAALAAEGITLSYHNHEQEFIDQVSDGVSGYDLLLAEVNPANAGFELDIGWSAVGGADPAALMAENPGRFHMLHVRDLKVETAADGTVSAVHTAIGEGDMDWEAIFAQSESAGVQWFIIELSEPRGIEASCDNVKYLIDNFT